MRDVAPYNSSTNAFSNNLTHLFHSFTLAIAWFAEIGLLVVRPLATVDLARTCCCVIVVGRSVRGRHHSIATSPLWLNVATS